VADFDGGQVTSDAGVLLLREVERRLGLIRRVAKIIRDRRHPGYTRHSIRKMLSQRVFQIACGYEDADDADTLRDDPALKMACERLPADEALASQPTLSRLENAVTRTDLYRIAEVLVDSFIDSYRTPPVAILLDIDDTADTIHGHQQMALFNAFYDEYCYLPIHIYEGRTGTENLKYLLGLTPNPVLRERAASLVEAADRRFRQERAPVREFGEFPYRAKSWAQDQRIVVKAEHNALGPNTRFVVTNLTTLTPRVVYEKLYCDRGTMELMIKDHKTHLHSDRTSGHRFEANQFRLLLHSMAYILTQILRGYHLQGTSWARAQFDMIRLQVLKIGARVRQLRTRVKIHLPTSYPWQAEWRTAFVSCRASP